MITIVGDTHGTDGHRLEGRTREAVRAAETVIHTGDFTTEAVLDAFEAEAGADSAAGAEREDEGRFVAVYGNNDEPAVRERLAATRVVDAEGVRFAVVHGHERDDTALSYLARQESADIVAVGHSHEPGRRRLGGRTVLNPGSHADPRWYRPAHAELEPTGEGLRGRLVSPDGAPLAAFDPPLTGHE